MPVSMLLHITMPLLLLCRAAKTLLVYLQETNPTVYSWLYVSDTHNELNPHGAICALFLIIASSAGLYPTCGSCHRCT